MIMTLHGLMCRGIVPILSQRSIFLIQPIDEERIMNEQLDSIDPETLQGLEPISSLSHDRIKELAAKVSVENISADSVIFNEGDNDPDMIYVIEGEIRLQSSYKSEPQYIRAGMPESWNPLAPHQPRQVSATAEGYAEIIRIDVEEFDRMLAWDQMAASSADGDNLTRSAGDTATAQMTQSATFQNLPPANIEELFRRLELINAKVGDVIIRQGDPGDFYWLLDEGDVKVTRQMEPDGPDVELATLGAGSTFGEEALISDNPRNASITMLTDGKLRRLAKQDFIELLREPMVDWIELNEALGALGEALFLDVRVAAEYSQGHLPQASNIPLFELRQRIGELDKEMAYICYCSSGRRSSAAAFLLKQNGFSAKVLKGGLNAAPASFIIR